MSKELEALKRMEYFVNEEMGIKTFKQSGWHIEGTDDYEKVKEALQRLEAIENAKPNEAMESIEEFIEDNKKFIEATKPNNFKTILAHLEIKKRKLITIKQALLKSQEQEEKTKAFDLIDTKNVDIKLLKWAYPSVEAYNVAVREQKDYWWREELTKEEFEFLGRLADAK